MIQIDLQMPKCCDECFALDDNGDYPFCLISQDQRGYTFNTREKRMPTCPMKAQEPRVMTLDEVLTLGDKEIIYLENILDGKIVEEINPAIYQPDNSSDDDGDGFCCIVSSWRKSGFYHRESYGKTWRCWTSRPTDEQREEIPWRNT